MLAQPKVKRLLSIEPLPADGRLIEAWASMKELQAEGPACGFSATPKRSILTSDDEHFGGKAMRRVAALLLSLLVWLAMTAGPAAAQAPGPVTIYDLHGRDSITDRVARLLAPGMEAALGVPVSVRQADVIEIYRQLARGPKDGSILLISDPLGLDISLANEMARGRPGFPTAPVTKLTDGISVALVVPEASPIRDWAGFVAATKPGPVRLAYIGYHTTHGVAVGLIEHQLGTRLVDVEALTREAVLTALAAGTADAALMVSATLTPGAAPVRPIVTFGAERHRPFGTVPAFAELTGNRRDAFTMSLGLFGPQGVTPKAAAAITTAARKAAGNPATVAAAATLGIPLHVSDAAVLEEASRRNRALIKRIGMQPGQR